MCRKCEEARIKEQTFFFKTGASQLLRERDVEDSGWITYVVKEGDTIISRPKNDKIYTVTLVDCQHNVWAAAEGEPEENFGKPKEYMGPCCHVYMEFDIVDLTSKPSMLTWNIEVHGYWRTGEVSKEYLCFVPSAERAAESKLHLGELKP